AGRSLPGAIEIDARDLAFGAIGEVRFPHEHRKDGRLRGGVRIIAADTPFAEAEISAGSEPDAERVLVSLGQIAGRLRKRLIAEFPRGLGEQRIAEGLLLRRSGIGTRARSFERIAAFDDL